MPRAKLSVVRFLVVAILLASCGGRQNAATSHRRSTEGAITGLARDADTAVPLGSAEIHAKRPGGPDLVATAGVDGIYTLDHLAPGRYTLVGTYAGQTITTKNVTVDVGEATYVDMSFTPGRPVAMVVDWSDPGVTAVSHFHPQDGATLIEGTVTESGSHMRIAGAVVTAKPAHGDALLIVSDNTGRYKFDGVAPDVYVISAYYSVSGRAEIEVRRSDIHVEKGEGVEVPLLIETTRAN